MQQLQDEIETLNAELNNLKINSSRIEDEIKFYHEKILQEGGDRLRAQKQTVDSMKEQIDMLNEQITTSHVAKTKAEKDVIKFENSITKNQGEVELLNREVQELEVSIRQNAEASSEIGIRADRAKEVLTSLRNFNDFVNNQL